MDGLLESFSHHFPEGIRVGDAKYIIEKVLRSQEFFHKVTGLKSYGINLLLLLYIFSDGGNSRFLFSARGDVRQE
jgi:hypothetical protein